MKANLRLHRVLIGGEGSALDHNLVPCFCRTVKRHHHQMKIYRERIHYHNFDRLRSYQFRGLFGQQSVVRHPWMFRAEVAFHAEFGPVLQFLRDIV